MVVMARVCGHDGGEPGGKGEQSIGKKLDGPHARAMTEGVGGDARAVTEGGLAVRVSRASARNWMARMRGP